MNKHVNSLDLFLNQISWNKYIIHERYIPGYESLKFHFMIKGFDIESFDRFLDGYYHILLKPSENTNKVTMNDIREPLKVYQNYIEKESIHDEITKISDKTYEVPKRLCKSFELDNKDNIVSKLTIFGEEIGYIGKNKVTQPIILGTLVGTSYILKEDLKSMNNESDIVDNSVSVLKAEIPTSKFVEGDTYFCWIDFGNKTSIALKDNRKSFIDNDSQLKLEDVVLVAEYEGDKSVFNGKELFVRLFESKIKQEMESKIETKPDNQVLSNNLKYFKEARRVLQLKIKQFQDQNLKHEVEYYQTKFNLVNKFQSALEDIVSRGSKPESIDWGFIHD